MGAIGYHQIFLKGQFDILEISQFELKAGQNQHAEAKITGISKRGITLSDIEKAVSSERIKLIADDEEAGEQVLFHGVIQQVKIIPEKTSYEVYIEAASMSILLDQAAVSRSYQNCSATYEDVIQKVVQDTKEAYVLCGERSDVRIGNPIIQYEETNWEFLIRIASKIGEILIPDIQTGKPVLYLGTQKKEVETDFSEKNYKSGISQNFYKMGGVQGGQFRADYLYFCVESYKDYPIGAAVIYKGYRLFISYKHAVIKNGILCFDYIIGGKGLFTSPSMFNEKIRGMSILGKVIAAEQETVKVHLDIDKEQNVETAYSYEWTPVSGNIMYCMPQIGTRVALYMSDHDEKNAKVVNCMRENGSSCQDMTDFNNRLFTSEHGKQMQLTPKGCVFSSDFLNASGGELQLVMDDKKGIQIESGKAVTIIAKEGITFQAPAISAECFKELNLMQTGAPVSQESIQSPCGSISIFGNQEYYGNSVIIVPHGAREAFEPFKDDPEKGEFDWGGLIKNVITGIAVAVVAAAAIAAIAVTAGAAAPFMAIFAAGAIGGSVGVGCLAYSDYKSGNVSDVGRYAIKGISGAVSGSLALILGPTAGATKYGALVYSLKAGGASMFGALAGNTIEQVLEYNIYGDKISLGEFVISGALGLIGGAIAGAFSYGLIQGTSALANKLANGTQGQVLRWLRQTAGVRPKHYMKYVENAINATRMLEQNKIVITTVQEAYEWVMKEPIAVIAACAPAYKEIIIRCAIREGSYSGIFSILTSLFSTNSQSEKEKSQKIIQQYLEQYGY